MSILILFTPTVTCIKTPTLSIPGPESAYAQADLACYRHTLYKITENVYDINGPYHAMRKDQEDRLWIMDIEEQEPSTLKGIATMAQERMPVTYDTFPVIDEIENITTPNGYQPTYYTACHYNGIVLAYDMDMEEPLRLHKDTGDASYLTLLGLFFITQPPSRHAAFILREKLLDIAQAHVNAINQRDIHKYSERKLQLSSQFLETIDF